MTVEVVDEPEELEDIIEEMIRLGVAKMNVGCFARVESYSAAKQTCTCRPVVRASIKGGNSVQYPSIANVPVRFPAGGGFSITWPLSAGDQVWLDFGDRSIDEWMNSSAPKDIQARSKRRFHITDAVAYPGGRPGTKPLKRAGSTDLVIAQDDYDTAINNDLGKADRFEIRIGPAGMGIGDGGTTNDLLNILLRMLQRLAIDTNVNAATNTVAADEAVKLLTLVR